MKILVPRKQLNRFRKECRERYPIEHIAALFGKRSDLGNILVTRIAPLDHSKATADKVEISNINIRRSKMKALRQEDDWIGTIHSHCTAPKDECCWHMSDADTKTALEYGEAISGIVYVYEGGSRTSVHWYEARPQIEVVFGNF